MAHSDPIRLSKTPHTVEKGQTHTHTHTHIYIHIHIHTHKPTPTHKLSKYPQTVENTQNTHTHVYDIRSITQPDVVFKRAGLMCEGQRG